MKKKLVAVAVAGVLGAPLAAHAQTANVTLYGRLNVDFGSWTTRDDTWEAYESAVAERSRLQHVGRLAIVITRVDGSFPAAMRNARFRSSCFAG